MRLKSAAHRAIMPIIQIQGDKIPSYPEFADISLSLQPEISHLLAKTKDGVSEYTFANLYLFRSRYNYRLSVSGGALIISGEHDGEIFFMTPCGAPSREVLDGLFRNHEFWKGIPDSIVLTDKEELEQWGVKISEDRDNFDYLYLRTDLAELPGKKYHKKRSLVNAFQSSYASEEHPITEENLPQAMTVLDRWRQEKGSDGDYFAAREALELFARLGLTGKLFYADGIPVGWCLGESVAQGSICAIHFEKGIYEYRGVYQYINQRFAASLPDSVIYINREQDLGDEGMRQAKMTYRPSGFVRKYTGFKL